MMNIFEELLNKAFMIIFDNEEDCYLNIADGIGRFGIRYDLLHTPFLAVRNSVRTSLFDVEVYPEHRKQFAIAEGTSFVRNVYYKLNALRKVYYAYIKNRSNHLYYTEVSRLYSLYCIKEVFVYQNTLVKAMIMKYNKLLRSSDCHTDGARDRYHPPYHSD